MREKKNRLSMYVLVTAFTALLVLIGVCSYADNMIPNPSFENFTAGTTYSYSTNMWLDNWSFYGGGRSATGILTVITPGEHGNVAMQISRKSFSSDTLFYSDDIYVEQYMTYRIVFWAKSATGTPLSVNVASFINHRWGTWLRDSNCIVAPPTSWKKYVISYVAPAGCNTANISFRSQAIYGSVCFDNITMEETDNLFPDPGLDDYALGSTYSSGESLLNLCRFFSVSGSGGTMTVVDGRDSGGTALKLARTSMSADTGFGSATAIPVQAGHTYRLTTWVKSSASTPISLSAASYKSSNIWISDTVNSSFPTFSKWSQCAYSYTAPAGATSVVLGFRAGAVGDVTFDDITMVDEGNITGNLFPDPSFDSFALGSSYGLGETDIGPFRYFSLNGTGGTLNIVTGQDLGGTAVKLARTSGSSDTALDLWTAYKLRVPVRYGHIYKFNFSAKSTMGQSQLFAAMSNFLADMYTHFSDTCFYLTPGTDWTEFSCIYTPPSPSAVYVNAGFRALGDNSDVTIDNVSITDVSEDYIGLLSGIVTNALTGAVVADANVTIESDNEALFATTDTSGAYTIANAPAGSYTLVTTKSGYKTTTINNVGIGTNSSTQNVGVIPAHVVLSVSDTFTRTDTSPADNSLGATEGAYTISWTKTTAGRIASAGNANSYISGNTLVTSAGGSTYGTGDCGVGLGQSFMPADFDLSINMNWLNTSSSLWAGIGYRQQIYPAMQSGYFVKCPSDGKSISLLYNNNPIASATLTTTYPYWQNVTLRIVACGNSHKVYVNGTLALSATDNFNTGAGYISLFSDSTNSVAWDNLAISTFADGTLAGTVYDTISGKGIPGAIIADEAGNQVQSGSDGTYTTTLAAGAHALTACADGYISKMTTATIASSAVTTVDIYMVTAPISVGSIADASKLPNGSLVTIGETLVATVATGTFRDDSYYVEDLNRTFGIKIYNGKTVSVGSRISGLTGTIKSDPSGSGERCIAVIDMNVSSGNPLGALGMNNIAFMTPGTGYSL